MNDMFNKISSIGVAIIGVAIVAVIVSRHSKTSDVIRNAGIVFAKVLKVTVSPVN